MRLLKISAAVALIAGTLGVAGTASAQWHRDGHRVEDRRGYGDYRRGPRHHDARRWDRRGHHGYRNSRRCWTEWRHHRRIRVCR